MTHDRIAIWSDSTKFPNLALMKLSAWHKRQRDMVEWWNPLMNYDHIYASKVFTFTDDNAYLPLDTIKGGTGYGIYNDLAPEVDDCFPDYSIYPNCNYAIGFLTRGCIRNCPWCVVPRKEGKIRPYRDWHDVQRDGIQDVVLMDNNILACDYGIEQLKSMINQPIKIDLNQGMDARLITPDVAEILARVKWIRFLRMSCDTDSMLDVVLNAIRFLEARGVKPYRIFVYLLVQDVESAEQRALALRAAGAEVFAQPYRDFTNSIEPTAEQKAFARFVNRKEIFKTVEIFADYKKNGGK